MNEQELQELRDSLAEYMGWTPVDRGEGVDGGPPNVFRDIWKPDENSSQADLVEDKLIEDEVIYKVIMLVSRVGYNYVIVHTQVPAIYSRATNESKKLARALALLEAVTKSNKP